MVVITLGPHLFFSEGTKSLASEGGWLSSASNLCMGKALVSPRSAKSSLLIIIPISSGGYHQKAAGGGGDIFLAV